MPVYNPRPPMMAPWNPSGMTSADPRGITAADQQQGPDLDTPQGAQRYAQQYDQYVGHLQQQLAAIGPVQAGLQATAGWEQKKIQAELENAEKGRQNAWKIAQLQSETSRYGVDAQRQTALAQLKEQARQFDATHELDMKKFGLDVADSYTKYSQTPDMVWALNDFKGAMNRVGLGQGVAPISTNPDQPQPKTWEGFAALSGFETLPVVQAGAQPGGEAGGGAGRSTMPVGSGGGAPAGGMADTNGDGVPDARLKAMKAIGDAIPPSSTPGNDQQDWAALNAIRSLYFAGKPGSIEALGPARRKIAQSGMARLGYDPNLVEEDYERSKPWQQSVRRA